MAPLALALILSGLVQSLLVAAFPSRLPFISVPPRLPLLPIPPRLPPHSIIRNSTGSTAPPEGSPVRTLTTHDLAELAPYAQFARAAYCPEGAATWSCGAACDANKDFVVTLSGGDGDGVQYYYVGYSASLDTVVVGHQGTNPTKLIADLTDIRLLQGRPDPALFPNITRSALVHLGFRDEHARTARNILEEVTALMGALKTTRVAVVGHSLGGALAELDAVYLALNLPAALKRGGNTAVNVTVKAVTFGKPRVGNAAWATLVDEHVNMTRVNNMRDIVPVIPSRHLNYEHPRGEVHLLGAGNAVACPGNDDAYDPECQIQTVPTILQGNVLDHLGPYEGVSIGTIYCVA